MGGGVGVGVAERQGVHNCLSYKQCVYIPTLFLSGCSVKDFAYLSHISALGQYILKSTMYKYIILYYTGS